MIKYIGFLVIVLCFMIQNVYGQQQVMFTQYMYNYLAMNPAYAGSHETISATALIREQWTGMEGAPSSQTFSIHSPINYQRMSLGLLVLNDNIGVTNQTGIYASYAYRIPVSDKGKLSFGLQGGLSTYNARFSEVSITDPTFSNGNIKEMHPNVGFGLYYNTSRLYAGISTPQLIQNIFDKSNPDSDSKILRHYFTAVGYVFPLNRSLKLKPNVLIKMVDGAPMQIDINANLLIKEIVWIGFSWRSLDSIDGLFQIQVTDQLQFGYAYDFITTTDLSRVNNGSHEIMLNYKFNFYKIRVITPRYF
ncbi:MAG: type IX secretion system membrane protein PorP/SprF [Cyclobacteriaceae bacterium]|nr:type IX secretion system membrane protein PorP/SprF [Cyclobacteriaceae bacterium]